MGLLWQGPGALITLSFVGQSKTSVACVAAAGPFICPLAGSLRFL
jgi:hypothetical protein